MAQVAKRVVLFALAGCLVSANAIGGESQAQKDSDKGIHVGVGQGVVCDTVQQVERFTALMGESGSIANAITTVNTEVSDPRACGMVLAAFTRGDEVGEVRNANRSMKVIEITIIAVPVGDKWHFVTPLKQYAAFPAKGLEI